MTELRLSAQGLDKIVTLYTGHEPVSSVVRKPRLLGPKTLIMLRVKPVN
jgi:hypothetical protein